MPEQLSDESTLLLAAEGQATWDALSTTGLFNFTTGKNHNFKNTGLSAAVKLLQRQSIGELPPFYWMVPPTYESGVFRIPIKSKFVGKIAHRLIPRPEPSRDELEQPCSPICC